MPPLPSPWEAGLELSGTDALSFSPRMVSGTFRFDSDGRGGEEGWPAVLPSALSLSAWAEWEREGRVGSMNTGLEDQALTTAHRPRS